MLTKFVVAVLLATSTYAGAAEITCFAPVALRSVLSELIPQFESMSADKVVVEYGLVGALSAQVQRGEIVDVAILSTAQVGELELRGKVVAGSRVNVAQLGWGMFTRRDAAKPDIGSIQTFAATLKTVPSFAYADPSTGAPSGVYMDKLLERLGLGQDLKAKIVLTAPEAPLFTAVLDGKADLGFTLISEILAEPKVQFVGPLPAGAQDYLPHAAGLVVAGKQHEAGKRLIDFLTSAPAFAVLKARGFEASEKDP